MIILDTNVISEAMKTQMEARVQLWLDLQKATDLFFTAISLAELRLGIEILPTSKRKAFLWGALDQIQGQLFQNRILPFDTEAAYAYGTLVGRSRMAGRSIQVADGQIAAVHGYTVATRDTGPFEAAGVAVLNPWKL